MIDFTGIHYGAVLVAWIISMVIGGWWYSPAGFSSLWSRLSGVDIMKSPKKETSRALVFVAVSCLLQAFFLAVLLNSLRVQTAGEGIVAALVLWFGFTTLTTVGNTLYQRLSLKFWALNAAYFLVVMTINGALLAVWQ